MIPSLTPKTFSNWLSIKSNGYSVIYVKSRECPVCTRIYPLFYKLKEKYNEDDKFQFGQYTLNMSEQDFGMNTLGIDKVPTYIVYQGNQRIFHKSGVKNLSILSMFLSNLP